MGLWQKAQGLQSIGPTASSLGVILSTVLAGVLVFLLAKSHEAIYLALSVVPLLIAVLTIYGVSPKIFPIGHRSFCRWQESGEHNRLDWLRYCDRYVHP